MCTRAGLGKRIENTLIFQEKKNNSFLLSASFNVLVNTVILLTHKHGLWETNNALLLHKTKETFCLLKAFLERC